MMNQAFRITVQRNSVRIASKILFFLFLFVTSACIFVPFAPSMPGHGLDPSWILGMDQAVSQGLKIGEEIIFSFGPYSSIYNKSFHPSTDIMMLWGAIFLSLSYAAVFFILFDECKLPIKVFFLLTLAGFTLYHDAPFLYYPLLVGVYLIKFCGEAEENSPDKSKHFFAALFLLMSFGLLSLIKGSMFIACAAVISIVFVYFIVCRKWCKAAAVCVIPCLSLVLFWVLAGQPFLVLLSYLFNMVPIISGYTEAMVLKGPFSEVILYFASSCTLLIGIMRSNTFVKEKIAYLALFIVVLFLGFKGGFVRHDGHALIAGSIILLSAFLLASINPRSATVVLLASFVAYFLIVSGYTKINAPIFFDNVARTYVTAYDGLRSRIDNKDALLYQYTSAMERIDEISGVPQMQGTTDIYSWNQAGLIASKNQWNPRPVFQSYSAYTSELAELNRSHLLSADAPDNLIFKLETIDGRLPSMDDGASWPVMLSHYALDKAEEENLILRKLPAPRPLSEQVLKRGEYSLGEIIHIPFSPHPIFVRINIRPNMLGKMASILFKTTPLKMNVTLFDGSVRSFRVVSGMMDSGFFLSPLVENTNEFALLYAGSTFLEGKKVKHFSISARGGSLLWGERIGVEFSSAEFVSSSELIERLKPFVLSIPRLSVSVGGWNPGELLEGRVFKQTFKMSHSMELASMDLMLATFMRENKGVFYVILRDENQNELLRNIARMERLGDNAWFPVVLEEAVLLKADQRYSLELHSPDGKNGNAITWWGSQTGVIENGEAIVDGSVTDHDFNFRLWGRPVVPDF